MSVRSLTIDSTLQGDDQTTSLITALSKSYCAGREYIRRIGETFFTLDPTTTESVTAAMQVEPDLVPYECCRGSGVLSFWDDPSEDIYTLEDGQPV